MRLLQPCNVAYLVSAQRVFIVAINVNAGRIPILRFIKWDQGKLNIQTVISIIKSELGFQKPFGFDFPKIYIDNEDSKEG